jgi:hypothetical protein
MMAGKTSLIRYHIVREIKAKQDVIVFCFDGMLARWSEEKKEKDPISAKVTHDGGGYLGDSIQDPIERQRLHVCYTSNLSEKNAQLTNLLQLYPKAMAIVDEIQFFQPAETETFLKRELDNRSLVGVGLNLDWKKQMFPTIVMCFGYANRVKQKRATCSRCGKKANFTKRVLKENEEKEKQQLNVVDILATYEPRCLECFIK